MNDQNYMRRAIELAKKGAGWVNPNPQVGCIIVKDNHIIGEGWHTKFGALHAEREALAHCIEDPAGATAYVTLEPCCHWGKTPPCTEALVEAKISRVVIGSMDPNPLVAGKGKERLLAENIIVEEGILKDECDYLNAAFFHYIRTKKPYVIAKYAMTLDGKIATKMGKSKWITSEVARRRVHHDRHRFAAIMVGINTVLKDNPQLTCRIEGEKTRNPLRVVVDSNLRIPLESQLVVTASEVPTLIACAHENKEKAQQLCEMGCEVLTISDSNQQVNLEALLNVLGEKGIDSLLVEGGSTLLSSLFDANLVNRVQAYVAPKIFGGNSAPSPIGGEGIDCPDQAFLLHAPHVEILGDDVLLECEVR